MASGKGRRTGRKRRTTFVSMSATKACACFGWQDACVLRGAGYGRGANDYFFTHTFSFHEDNRIVLPSSFLILHSPFSIAHSPTPSTLLPPSPTKAFVWHSNHSRPKINRYTDINLPLPLRPLPSPASLALPCVRCLPTVSLALASNTCPFSHVLITLTHLLPHPLLDSIKLPSLFGWPLHLRTWTTVKHRPPMTRTNSLQSTMGKARPSSKTSITHCVSR